MFLRLNGWPIVVRDRSATESIVAHGVLDGAINGRSLNHRRALLRGRELEAILYENADADCLAGLIEGRGHRFPFDLDAHSDAGLGPDTPAAGSWSILPRTFGLTGNGIHGAGYLSVSATIVWDTLLPRDRWTVMYWRDVAPKSASTQHIAVRADGTVWTNGVAGGSATGLVVDEDLGAVALTAGTYDDLVVLPYNASASFIEAFYRWSTAQGLAFHVPILDGTARDTLVNAGAPTIGGTATVQRTGGKTGGCVVADAAGEYVEHAASAAFQVDGRDEFTAEAWVRANAGSVVATRRVIGNQNAGGTAGWRLDLRAAAASAGGRLAARATLITAAGAAEHSSPTTPTDVRNLVDVGADVHLVMTWAQATGIVTLYVNGRAVDRVTGFFTNQASAPASDAALAHRIGNDSAGTAQVDGRVSGVRVYGKALTATEVRERFLMGMENEPGPEPHPFSALPNLRAEGEAVGGRAREVSAETREQTIVQHGPRTLTATPGWRTNSRNVPFALAEASRERPRAPVPLWSFALAEDFVDGSSLRPMVGSAAGVLPAAGSFAPGPYARGRARSIGGGSGAGRVELAVQHATCLAGLASCSVVAWVRRNTTVSNMRVLSLNLSSGVSKLQLLLSSGVNIDLRSRPATADTLRVLNGLVPITDTDRFHLVGGFVDVANDRMGVFHDDAGLGAASSGQYTTGATAFTSSVFSAEAEASECAIGALMPASSGWNGDIALVALYPGILSATQVHAMWEAGRRGIVR